MRFAKLVNKLGIEVRVNPITVTLVCTDSDGWVAMWFTNDTADDPLPLKVVGTLDDVTRNLQRAANLD